jgi:hypothetical protein
MGTLVYWHEPERILRQNLTVDVVAHAWRGIVVDVIRVVLWAIPREDLEEGVERGDVSPHCTEKDGAS